MKIEDKAVVNYLIEKQMDIASNETDAFYEIIRSLREFQDQEMMIGRSYNVRNIIAYLDSAQNVLQDNYETLGEIQEIINEVPSDERFHGRNNY